MNIVFKTNQSTYKTVLLINFDCDKCYLKINQLTISPLFFYFFKLQYNIGKLFALFKALFLFKPTDDMVLKPYYYEKIYFILS